MFERLFGGKPTDPAIAERIPPGQYKTDKFPVLHYGSVPKTDLATWDFKVYGEVDSPFTLTWDEFKALPRKTGRHGHPLRDPLDEARHDLGGRRRSRRSWSCAQVRPEATHVVAHCRAGLHREPAAVASSTTTTSCWPTRSTASRSSRSTATRSGCSSRSATSGRAPSGSAASSSSTTTSWASGSATATTTTPIPGRKSASASSPSRPGGGLASAVLVQAYLTRSSPSHCASASSSASTAAVMARRERDVLVHGPNVEHRGLAIGRRVDLADQPVAVEDRQREVAPPPVGRRLVHLEQVFEVEQLHRRGPGRGSNDRTATAARSVPRSPRRSPPGRPATGRTFPRPRPAGRPPRRPSGGRCRATAAAARRGSGAPYPPGRPACRPDRPAPPGPTGVGVHAGRPRRYSRATRGTRASGSRSDRWSSRSTPRARPPCPGCPGTPADRVGQLVEDAAAGRRRWRPASRGPVRRATGAPSCRRDTGRGRPSRGPWRSPAPCRPVAPGARTSSGPPRAPVAGGPADTRRRVASRPRGRRSVPPPRSDPAAGTSGDRPRRRDPAADRRRGAGPGSRSGAPRRGSAGAGPRTPASQPADRPASVASLAVTRPTP